jgi:hypothetical protein
MRSMIEANHTTLDTTTMEVEWLRELTMDLSDVENPILTIFMDYDSQMRKHIIQREIQNPQGM